MFGLFLICLYASIKKRNRCFVVGALISFFSSVSAAGCSGEMPWLSKFVFLSSFFLSQNQFHFEKGYKPFKFTSPDSLALLSEAGGSYKYLII